MATCAFATLLPSRSPRFHNHYSVADSIARVLRQKFHLSTLSYLITFILLLSPICFCFPHSWELTLHSAQQQPSAVQISYRQHACKKSTNTMNPIRPLLRLSAASVRSSPSSSSRLPAPSISSISRRRLTTPSAPLQASVSEVKVDRGNVKEDPGEGDELMTENAPSGKG